MPSLPGISNRQLKLLLGGHSAVGWDPQGGGYPSSAYDQNDNSSYGYGLGAYESGAERYATADYADSSVNTTGDLFGGDDEGTDMGGLAGSILGGIGQAAQGAAQILTTPGPEIAPEPPGQSSPGQPTGGGGFKPAPKAPTGGGGGVTSQPTFTPPTATATTAIGSTQSGKGLSTPMKVGIGLAVAGGLGLILTMGKGKRR